jgi:hypothetical protein
MTARTLVALAAAGLSLTGCVAATSSSGGSCAQPDTVVSHTRVHAEQVVTVSAADMWDGCNDQGAHPPLPPLRNLPVTWVQSGRTTTLATVDADPRTGVARATVTVPPTATAGRATISIGLALPTVLTVTRPETRPLRGARVAAGGTGTAGNATTTGPSPRVR